MECFDLGAICRFCLKSECQLYLLLGLHQDPELIIQNVRQLTTIELSTSDNIDHKICSECCTIFEMCIKFRQMCIEMNQILENIKLPSRTETPPSTKSPVEIKKEIECSLEPMKPSIDNLFSKEDDDSFSQDHVNLEQYGLNIISPPLFDTDNWPDPPWIGFQWEQNELPFEASHSTIQKCLPTFFHLNPRVKDSSSKPTTSPTRIVRSKYFCKICEKHFFQRNVHMQHHERYSKTCFQCLDEKVIGVFRPEAALNRHTCCICAVVKETCAEFLQHAIAHHAEEHRAKDSYKCYQCDKVFMVKNENSHGKVHNCVRKLRCPHCPQAFYYAKSFQKHLRANHSHEVGKDDAACGDGRTVVSTPSPLVARKSEGI